MIRWKLWAMNSIVWVKMYTHTQYHSSAAFLMYRPLWWYWWCWWRHFGQFWWWVIIDVWNGVGRLKQHVCVFFEAAPPFSCLLFAGQPTFFSRHFFRCLTFVFFPFVFWILSVCSNSVQISCLNFQGLQGSSVSYLVESNHHHSTKFSFSSLRLFYWFFLPLACHPFLESLCISSQFLLSGNNFNSSYKASDFC